MLYLAESYGQYKYKYGQILYKVNKKMATGALL